MASKSTLRTETWTVTDKRSLDGKGRIVKAVVRDESGKFVGGTHNYKTR